MTNEGQGFDVVTGAFGYTGKYIARRLLSEGRRVRTLTGHPNRRNPFGASLEIAPLDFSDSAGLRRALEGADALYNTYWVRFSHGSATFESAVAHTRKLFAAAGEAGVRRVVHVSITNPSEDSPLPYFSGKAKLEESVGESGLSYAILRPTVIFGPEDILINNIAWLLRRAPVFAIAGAGDYRLQPVFVEDVADLAVRWGSRQENVTLDAVGPEVFTYRELVERIAEAIGRRARVVSVSPSAVLLCARMLRWLVGDVVLTREELDGLMAGLLVSSAPPTAPTRLSGWLRENAGTLGRRYASELARHYR